MEDYLLSVIISEEDFYRNIIDTIIYNRDTYESYLNETLNIETSATEEFCQTFGFTYSKFIRYEKRVFSNNLLNKPQFDVTVYCKASYTSPRGRNHYCEEESFDFDELKYYYDRAMELKAHRQTRQYQIKMERAKMTDSLRYDILKRDNFRCQICGSNAQDGVKLHVDHITPVSKGGQTIKCNLRTLCDRCNMGKSDKL